VRFLADGSYLGVVRALRSAGFDVLAVAEISPRASDESVADLAIHEAGVLLTEDKDFGQFAYASARQSPGVILVRFPAHARGQLAADVVGFIPAQGEQMQDAFAESGPVGFESPASQDARITPDVAGNYWGNRGRDDDGPRMARGDDGGPRRLCLGMGGPNSPSGTRPRRSSVKTPSAEPRSRSRACSRA
jgi:predicted nuclease of predicted toxin-antitoxin system